MVQRAGQLKDEIMDAVVGHVRERLDPLRAEPIERFVRQFYANVPPDDIAQASAGQLYGAALAMWQWCQQRRPDEALVRVYNPRVDQHGWQSPRTVVEIVNDDMPFLVASVTAVLNRQGVAVHLVIHPVFRVRRDADGRLVELGEMEPVADGGASPPPVARLPMAGSEIDALTTDESAMHVEVSARADPAVLEAMRTGILAVLGDVRATVDDWEPMRRRVDEAVDEAGNAAAVLPEAEVDEAKDFLRWLKADHFTFLGYRNHRFENGSDVEGRSDACDGGLGIMRDEDVSVLDGLCTLAALPPDVRDFLRQPRLLMIARSNRVSTVHRAVPMDVILVKRFDATGRVIGERVIAGLFTAAAYNRSPREIPFLRCKVADVLTRAGFPPHGHDGKVLLNILETFPRDELFQIETGDLLDMALGILHLQERQRLALFIRKDPFERFASCLVYVPRDRYDTRLRLRIQAILEQALAGTCRGFFTQLTDGLLARLRFIVATEPGRMPAIDVAAIEARLVQASRDWTDLLREALVEARGEETGLVLLNRYANAFPTGYREVFPAAAAVSDIERIEAAVGANRLGISLYRPLEARSGELHLKLYHGGEPVPLSDVLPMLEHMDLTVITEQPYEVRPAGRPEPVWIHEFTTRATVGADDDWGRVKALFQDAFAAVWDGRMEDDGFNRLVLRAGLTALDVTVLRAYAKYLRQARFPLGQDTIEATFAAHPAITVLLVRLFHTRFDPFPGDARARDGRAAEVAALTAAITHALDGVDNLDEDRILRRTLNLMVATLRTNAFQRDADGAPRPWIAVKLDSQVVDELPLPRPWVEVFVYAPRVEGIHLRGGKVARGGIRWSDRREDFRTEILGLMKAQMVKNAVIVPVGSKGGFVVKRPPAGRDALAAEGVECYRTLIRGLLDITDTLTADGRVVPPADVVRYDGDDPYLVVAADKGTASFSDIANGISADCGFWLGDAFASGGSAGYDHKKMAITARGAWESVKRHFRELGRDIQAGTFSCVGIGDMSGDVFGNAMLLSRHMRLLAAFDHRHIICDPDPDPERSWIERRRLFDLPRSSWGDYDQARLSPGGRVFARTAKSLELTPEIKARFGFTTDHITPAGLVRGLLAAKVDLLWFGGIGTFVKAAAESNAEVGDKANDALRIDGRDIGALVVGEGANLAITQRGRIEAALAGVRLNSDAIDNSAGVDTSDHEVNIKILLGDVVARGDMTLKQRDRLLVEMTDEVAWLVLSDNYLQTQALTVAEAQAAEALEGQARFMRTLERAGRLNRAVEHLPDDEELASRMALRRGLTRPELAVLLAYAKITLYDELLATSLPDDPFMAGDLARYFPVPLHERFAAAIARHRLRREIIATAVTNSMVNRVGPTFVREMMEKTGMGPADVARAYTIVRDAFQLRPLWADIAALDTPAPGTTVPAAAQTAMLLEIVRLMERTVAWFLSHAAHPLDIAGETAALRPGVEAVVQGLDGMLDAEEAARLEGRCAGLVVQGVPAELARRVATLPVLAAAPDLVRIATGAASTVTAVAAAYFTLGRRFGLEWLRDKAVAVKTDNHWQKQAVSAIVDDLFAHQTQLTLRVLACPEGRAGDQPGAASPEAVLPLDAWILQRRPAVDRVERLMAELRTQPAVDLAMLAVANRQLRGLTAG
jgi:glutamate dehydrogenase